MHFTLAFRYDVEFLIGYDIKRLSWGYLKKRSEAIGMLNYWTALSRCIARQFSVCSIIPLRRLEFIASIVPESGLDDVLIQIPNETVCLVYVKCFCSVLVANN